MGGAWGWLRACIGSNSAEKAVRARTGVFFRVGNLGLRNLGSRGFNLRNLGLARV